ncbi:neutral/alkaline non-lysosomal ceramidase N-terminal domain-containing protein, partial [Singulisphaera rosea]
WMAGYGSRDHPSEGKVHDLWAKALVLDDPAGGKAALVTVDICGIGRDLSVRIRDTLKAKLGLSRERVVIACSHTHCGPVVGNNLRTMFRLDDEQLKRVDDYAKVFEEAVVDTVVKAAANLEPVTLAWGNGQADFAVNRRNNKEPDVPALRENVALQGPIDHDVPVLRLNGKDGRAKAIVFGYACHCTVLSFYQFCGDYAGFAQLALEASHPGAQAMFVAGCGADQNPLPRRTVELAEAYGTQLAESVEHVLKTPMRPITTPLRAADTEVAIAFGTLPSRDQIERDAKASDFYIANRAKALLKTIESQGSLSKDYPYPVQAWILGDLSWVFLGGEVVVDYSLRIKRNLGSSKTWVSAYCNDVCAYMPSLRVLKEGGYEGATSMIYYGHPTSWAESIEEDIIGAVGRVMKTAKSAP